jgi:hypothetical protein
MSAQIKFYLLGQQKKLREEIDKLNFKISLLDGMIADLDLTPEKIKIEKQNTAKQGRPNMETTATKQALIALEAAGEQGLSSLELAEVAHLPKGTASSRLHLMKKHGMVDYHDNRYFAMHSDKDDNNLNNHEST